MVGTDPGSAREEAERLVATALAAMRLAASGATGFAGPGPLGRIGDLVTGVLTGHPGAGPDGGRFATGTPECCVCPICRTIVALRDPSPEFAERLATGAGDLAAGLASLMRAFSAPGADTGATAAPAPQTAEPPVAPAPPPAAPAPPTPRTGPAGAGTGASVPHPDQVWRSATRTGHDSQPTPERDVWAAATDAAAGTPPTGAVPPADDAGSTTVHRPASTGVSDPGPEHRPTVAVGGPAAATPAGDGGSGDEV